MNAIDNRAKELRLLDVKIARKVFGLKIDELHQKHGWVVDYRADIGQEQHELVNEPIYAMDMVDGYRLKRFSTRIEYAMELINLLASQGKAVIMQNDTHELCKSWFVFNSDVYGLMSRGWEKDQHVEGEGETAAEAICNFVLEASDAGLFTVTCNEK